MCFITFEQHTHTEALVDVLHHAWNTEDKKEVHLPTVD